MPDRSPPADDSADLSEDDFDFRDEFPELAPLLGNEAVWHDAPSDLEDVVVAAIADEAAQDRFFTGQGSPTPMPAVVELPPTRSPARWLQAVAAVALVVVGFGAAVLLVGGDDGRGGDSDVVLELAGSEIAPDASAVAAIKSTPAGVRIILDVSGLAPAPPGSYYQAWMRNAEGGVTAGTFHLRGGDAEIELWSGVLIDDYPIFSVTLQEEGAGTDSSGVVVLVGEVGG